MIWSTMAAGNKTGLNRAQLAVVYETTRLAHRQSLTKHYIERLGGMPVSAALRRQLPPYAPRRLRAVTTPDQLPLIFGVRQIGNEEELLLQLECIDTTTGNTIESSRVTLCSFEYLPTVTKLARLAINPGHGTVGELILGVDRLRAQAEVGLSDPPPEELVAYRQQLAEKSF